MTLPMSFSDAVNKEMVVVEAEKAREGDTPCAQTTMASQPRGTEDVDEEEEKVELRMPGSFGFGDRGSGVACEAGEPSICSVLSVCSGICGGGCS